MLTEIVKAALDGGRVPGRAEYLRCNPIADIDDRRVWDAVPSDARAYYSSIKVARNMLLNDVTGKIKSGLEKLGSDD